MSHLIIVWGQCFVFNNFGAFNGKWIYLFLILSFSVLHSIVIQLWNVLCWCFMFHCWSCTVLSPPTAGYRLLPPQSVSERRPVFQRGDRLRLQMSRRLRGQELLAPEGPLPHHALQRFSVHSSHFLSDCSHRFFKKKCINLYQSAMSDTRVHDSFLKRNVIKSSSRFWERIVELMTVFSWSTSKLYI